MPELNGEDAEKVETVTKVVEGLYQDNLGDHEAVISHHERIAREYGLTNEQWVSALRQAQQNIYDPGRREEAKYYGESAADPINAPVTASKEWLQQEAERIREASELAVPAAEADLAAAYWNGRREGFNSVREDVLAKYPDRANDLPEAIQVDEILVRQVQQEQTIDRSLATAR
jgi:hypothetical protein